MCPHLGMAAKSRQNGCKMTNCYYALAALDQAIQQLLVDFHGRNHLIRELDLLLQLLERALAFLDIDR